MGDNAYRIEIPSHQDKVVTVNVNRLKRFRGRWTRPYMDEFPPGVDEENDDSPLEEEDLPPSSYTERVTVGKEDTVIVGAGVPLMEVVAKRCVNRTVEYLVLTSTFETHWLPRSALMPEYASLVTAYEQSERKKNRLPALRRGARLAEANAEVDEEYVLLA